MHELLEFLNHNYIVKAFGLSLLHSLWQGAAIAALLWLLLKIATQLSAGMRYGLALTALCSLLVCFGSTLYVQLNTLTTSGGIAEEANALVHFSSGGTEQAVAERDLFQQLERGWNLLFYWLHQHVVYFFMAWATGFFIFSLRFFTGLYYLQDLKQESNPFPEGWSEKTSVLKQKLGLSKKIRLLTSDKVNAPLTFGWLKPVIIFPLSMISLLPDDQIESILLHELAHIRRNDYLTNLLQSFIEIIFFFNPGYWYISGVLEREREHICDDMVVAHAASANTYARALTNLAELSNFKTSQLAMNIAQNKNSLLFRIKRIIHPSKPDIMEKSIKRKSYQIASLIIACILLVFLTIDVNGNNGQAEISQKDKNQPAATQTGRKISGMVLSKYGGTPLPGVAVTIKNSTTGTVTDFDGNYSLNAQPSDTLLFSFVGFHKKEVAINNQNYHAIVLESIEKPENSRVVIEDIKVKENAEDPAPVTITKKEGNALEEGSRIFIIPEDEDIKAFFRYIKNADIQDIEHHGREISKSELEATDPAKIKSNLTISSEESGYKKAVTLIKLKGAEDKAEVASGKEEKPQPLFILLEEDVLGPEPGSPEYKNALSRGRQLSDVKGTDPSSIASMHILKGEQATASLGEAGRNGVVFITLKKSEKATQENESKAEDHFVVFPNPSNGVVKVSFLLETEQHVKLDVLDPNGNKVYIFVDQVLDKGTHQYEWNASDRQAGIYTIMLRSVNEVKTRKLVLE